MASEEVSASQQVVTAAEKKAAFKAYQKRWREANKDRLAQNARERYLATREHHLKLCAEWAANNKDRRARSAKARYERQKAERAAARSASAQERAKEAGIPLKTRADAKAEERPRFFTGEPCPRGHLAERFSSNGRCMVCQQQDTQRWTKANPDKAKASYEAWHDKNGDRDKQRRAEYRERTRPERLKVSRAWYEANKSERAITVAAWRAKNKFRTRAIRHNYLAKRKSGGTHTAADILSLFDAQKGKCAYSWCRKDLKSAYHVDHVMPISKGGTNDRRNLQLLCPTCNLKKNAKHPIDFAQENGLLL